MHLITVHRTFPRLRNLFTRSASQVATQNQDEYTDTPEYPPILDMSLAARKLRERQAIHQKIQKLNTVEEKQIGLNMPRYYGWRCVMLTDNLIPYNAMPMIQCYTRTHFRPMDKLPEVYDETAAAAEVAVKEVKTLIEDAIAFEMEGVERNFTPTLEAYVEPQKEDFMTKCIVRQINRVISNNLADKASHILSAQVDYDPRHEAFWFVGGTDVPGDVIKWRRQYNWLKNRLHEPVDRSVQYLGNEHLLSLTNNELSQPLVCEAHFHPNNLHKSFQKARLVGPAVPIPYTEAESEPSASTKEDPLYLGRPLLTVRSHQPLKPIIPYRQATNPEFKVEKFPNQPISVGYTIDHRHGTNIPGFWPGEYDEFGLLSIHGRGHILSRKESYGEEDNLEALHCHAMKASFGWLLAQANYQGFTTYNDLTYPLVTQTVLTNGKLWSFYAYQLNTITMHNEQMDLNPKHNVCFGTKPLQLYETIENGQVKGLNEDVLKMLLQFYLNSPEKREHEMKPYLGKEEKLVADIEDDNKRCWLESRYKHMVSNRPKHYLTPEIYHWEKIYKIQFNTRFFERKVRPFELGENPFKRRLNEHLPPYIPKVLRPYPRHKKHFETTYYPDV